jgi:hypothetical protein
MAPQFKVDDLLAALGASDGQKRREDFPPCLKPAEIFEIFLIDVGHA